MLGISEGISIWLRRLVNNRPKKEAPQNPAQDRPMLVALSKRQLIEAPFDTCDGRETRSRLADKISERKSSQANRD